MNIIKWVLHYGTKLGVINAATVTGTVPHIKGSVMKSETHWASLDLTEATSQLHAKAQDFLSGPFPAPSSWVRNRQPSQVGTWHPDTERLEFKSLLCPMLAAVTWGKLLNLSAPQSPEWGRYSIFPSIGAGI